VRRPRRIPQAAEAKHRIPTDLPGVRRVATVDHPRSGSTAIPQGRVLRAAHRVARVASLVDHARDDDCDVVHLAAHKPQLCLHCIGLDCIALHCIALDCHTGHTAWRRSTVFEHADASMGRLWWPTTAQGMGAGGGEGRGGERQGGGGCK
jgi:hypothetical protein